MKTINFKRHKDVKRGTKYLHISSRTESKECITLVRKGFLYKAQISQETEPEQSSPEIFIRKAIDTEKNIEKFSFHVKGTFYMSHSRKSIRVDFHHSLNIKIVWKKKVFSPEKSEVLT